MGIVLAGFLSEIDDPVPAHWAEWWASEMPYCLHSATWWRRHWERSGILEIAVDRVLFDGLRNDGQGVFVPERAMCGDWSTSDSSTAGPSTARPRPARVFPWK